MTDPIAREARPRLVLGGAENEETNEARRSHESGLIWVLAGLLAFAIVAAAIQS